MPEPGEIIVYKDYEFEDGSKRDKLFVILSKLSVTSPCLVLKTTSQSKRYGGVKQGCNPQKKIFFVPVTWVSCFKSDTYIQLPQVIEISAEEYLNSHFSKKINIVSSLPPDCFAQLKTCLKQFKSDISPQHWSLIFQ